MGDSRWRRLADFGIEAPADEQELHGRRRVLDASKVYLVVPVLRSCTHPQAFGPPREEEALLALTPVDAVSGLELRPLPSLIEKKIRPHDVSTPRPCYLRDARL